MKLIEFSPLSLSFSSGIFVMITLHPIMKRYAETFPAHCSYFITPGPYNSFPGNTNRARTPQFNLTGLDLIPLT
jgi:hypothetical protein